MKRQPYLIIIYAILTVGAFLFGIMAWLFLPDMLVDQLRSFIAEQMQMASMSSTWKDTVVQILQVNAMDLLRVYLCGLCLLGAPLLIVFLFMKCFSVGFSACVLLQSSIVLLISRILFLPVLVIAVSLGCQFAVSLLKNHVQSPIHQLLRYTMLFAVILLAVIMVSIIDGTANYYYLQQF